MTENSLPRLQLDTPIVLRNCTLPHSTAVGGGGDSSRKTLFDVLDLLESKVSTASSSSMAVFDVVDKSLLLNGRRVCVCVCVCVCVGLFCLFTK